MAKKPIFSQNRSAIFFFFFFFFFKILPSSVAKQYGQLSPSTISEKTSDPIFRKLSDVWTDTRTRVILQDAVRLTSSAQHIFEKKNHQGQFLKAGPSFGLELPLFIGILLNWFLVLSFHLLSKCTPNGFSVSKLLFPLLPFQVKANLSELSNYVPCIVRKTMVFS